MHGETDAGGDALHAFIFGENFSDDAFELFVAAKLHQTGQQFGANALALVLIADQDGELGFAAAVEFGQLTEADDFATTVAVALLMLSC